MPMPASTISTPAGSGPPNSAEMAEKEPAVASTAFSRSPSFTILAAATPTTEPSAISGASGPSTSPKESVPIAASATPGPAASAVGAMLSPPNGSWPPSPGRKRRATITTTAPASGIARIRNQGALE